MKLLQKILLFACWLFITISALRVLNHIIINDVNTLKEMIGLIPILLFICVAITLSGSLVFRILKSKNRLSD